jgi:glycosyltransferase involved in cell wall biosynthesis
MEPLVSIIIPNHNRANLIGETLDSIIQQSYSNWECLVIDDGSTDASEVVINAYCEKDKRFRFYKRPSDRPKGANACRNFGFELSKGAYINWFDSDDLMHPKKLQLQLDKLQNSDKPFCVCQSYVFEKDIKSIIGLKSEIIISDHIFDDFLHKRIVIPILAPVFKKSFLIEGQFYFDESLQAGQEWDLFIRVLFNTQDYLVVEKPLDYIRKHSDSISGLNISDYQLWYYFIARFKVFNNYKVELSENNVSYLKRYFLLIYKLLLRKSSFIKAFKVWKKALLSDTSFTTRQHALLILSFISFMLFKKGDIFLSKVNRWNI